MLRRPSEIIQKHCLWLSLLIHFMLVGTYVVKFAGPLQPLTPHEPMPSYVPSYVEQGQADAPAVAPQIAKQPEPKKVVEKKPVEVAKNGIEKPVAKKTTPPATPVHAKSGSRSVNTAPQKVTEAIVNDNHEPMHLIGESKIIKPLVKILAKALGEHLTYPKIAQDFNLRGTVLVGFVLHPQGYVTETKIVKSSGAGVLDDAAREAVNGMSPVAGVGGILDKSEYLVVGIIFG